MPVHHRGLKRPLTILNLSSSFRGGHIINQEIGTMHFLIGNKVGCITHPLEFSLLQVSKYENLCACFPPPSRKGNHVPLLGLSRINSDHGCQ